MLLRSLIVIVALLLVAGHRLVDVQLFPQEGPLGAITQPYQYDLWRWEMDNLPRRFLSPPNETGASFPKRSGSEAVEEYFALSGYIAQRQSQIRQGASLGPELAEAEARHAALKDDVETALEAEVTAALREAGLTLFGGSSEGGGLVFPPVKFALTSPPHILMVSARERIEVEARVLLRPEMSLAQIEAVESAVETQGKSALIEPVGGFAAYPSMIPADASLEFAVGTVAHEWVHHYLFFRPLGMRYAESSEMTTINETVANLVGQELGDRVLTRLGRPRPPAPPPRPPDPTAFDFNREMRQIRLRVDELLAQGQVAEAEAFMAERHDFLASRGYFIRKLNQAYFAFHGSYADSPASVSPVAEQLRQLRRESPSLAAFLETVASFTRPEDLTAALSRLASP